MAFLCSIYGSTEFHFLRSRIFEQKEPLTCVPARPHTENSHVLSAALLGTHGGGTRKGLSRRFSFTWAPPWRSARRYLQRPSISKRDISVGLQTAWGLLPGFRFPLAANPVELDGLHMIGGRERTPTDVIAAAPPLTHREHPADGSSPPTMGGSGGQSQATQGTTGPCHFDERRPSAAARCDGGLQ